MTEKVVVTETPKPEAPVDVQYSPSLSDANHQLRKAVAERHARRAVDPNRIEDCEQECCQGSRLPTAQVSERVPHQSYGSPEFMEILEELKKLHCSKSHDYGETQDPLANVRSGAELIGVESWRACLIRVADKIQRLKTYCSTGQLKFETVEDTLLDLASYSIISLVLHRESKRSSL
tara:strand:+ start:424 stop:954 length:531 start_codon:yes stop_codon:yes gene_type:complete